MSPPGFWLAGILQLIGNSEVMQTQKGWRTQRYCSLGALEELGEPRDDEDSGGDGGLKGEWNPGGNWGPGGNGVLEEMRISELMGDLEIMKAQKGHPQV